MNRTNEQTEARPCGFDGTTPARTIETITSEIRALQRGTLVYAIEIGRRLVEAKELLPHGEWGRWLTEEVDFSQSTANNLMKLFDEYGSPQTALFGAELNSQTFGNLSYSKALKLLALPAGEREEFAAEHDVEGMSTRELDKIIAERDAEKLRADKLRDDKNKLKEKFDALNDKYSASADETERLRSELEELKARPIDVILGSPQEPGEAGLVTTLAADPAEIDKAVEEATKEREAEIKALEKKLEEAEKAAAMSDPVTTEFKVIFGEVQQKLGRLIELAVSAGENGGKLSAALGKMLETFASEVRT